MKAAAIKELVAAHDLESLKAAEAALLNEEQPAITVEGADEGEQLTHILGAIAIREQLASGVDERTALRNFMQRVRNSIS